MTIDQEMIAIEKTVCYSVHDKGTFHTMQGHTRQSTGQSGDRRIEGEAWQELLFYFPWERQGKAG